MPIIGHGIDIVSIARIEQMLGNHPDRFAQRCFTEAERTYCDAGGRNRTERYAARFAAKEAVYKALGATKVSGLGWLDAEVINQDNGRPTLRISGQAAAAAAELGIENWTISLSHTADAAIASVIAEGSASAAR